MHDGPSSPLLLPSAAPRIAIIGGGITGLAAAHRVTELLPRAELHLFEASSRLGGILETMERDGFLIERSADNFLTKNPAALDLCRRLGFADDLVPTDESRRRALVVHKGRLQPVPTDFYLMAPRRLGPVLKSPILSPRGKLRLLLEPLIAVRKPSPSGRGQGEGARRYGPDHAPDESVASFARRRLGREVFERLVQPLVAGIYTADPEKLSMAATMPDFLAEEQERGHLLTLRSSRSKRPGRLSDQSDARTGPFDDDRSTEATGARYNLFVAPKAGMTSLVNAIAARLAPTAVHVSTNITRVLSDQNNSWQLEFGPPSPLRLPPSFHALILAVPGHAAARLLETSLPDLATELAAIEHASSAVISLGFERKQIRHPLDGFGFVVPQVENRRIIAASFASQKFPGRAPEGAVIIRAFIGGALQPELLELCDNELLQIAIDELRDLLHISGRPLTTDVVRWNRAMPQYHVGHIDRVARIEQLAAAHPTLTLAGNAYHGVGIPQCVASAEAAAERIALALT